MFLPVYLMLSGSLIEKLCIFTKRPMVYQLMRMYQRKSWMIWLN